jgi:hypothetical protein
MVLKFKRHRQVGTGNVCNQQICVNTPATRSQAWKQRARRRRRTGIAFRGLCVSAIFFDVTQICGVASQTAARKVGGGVGMNVPAIGCAVCLVA